MAKMTLLDIVQNILNDMDSEEVNSINDTVESQQIAAIVKQVYYHIIDGETWPHLNQLFQLDASGTLSNPTRMRLPEEVVHLNWLKYNVKETETAKDVYETITYLDPETFVETLNGRDSTATNIQTVVDSSGVKLYIQKDKKPAYWTSFDDMYVVMDSFDTSIDSTLQNSKTQCHGLIRPEFSEAAWQAARRWPARALAAWATALALVVFVGVGRLYHGVHWPTDVLGGWLLGAAQAAVALRLLRPPAP